MKKRGFTIIELLVVIAIIGMLFTVIFAQIANTRAKSRDARREEDIKSIQNALGLYAFTRFVYPLCATEVAINGNLDCLSAELVTQGAIPRVPTDPFFNTDAVCGSVGFVYCYQSSSDGTGYTLRYRLETDSIHGKSAGWQSINP